MEGLTIATLFGPEAGTALRLIMDRGGRIFCVTPLPEGKNKGEKIWYQVGQQFYCIRTDRVESPTPLYGQTGTDCPSLALTSALCGELQLLCDKNIEVGFPADRMLAMPV